MSGHTKRSVVPSFPISLTVLGLAYVAVSSSVPVSCPLGSDHTGVVSAGAAVGTRGAAAGCNAAASVLGKMVGAALLWVNRLLSGAAAFGPGEGLGKDGYTGPGFPGKV